MEKNNSLKKNAILNIIYKLSSMIFPMIIYPYVSRVLDAEYLGKVTFFSNIASYGMLIGALGISTYGIRAVAKVRDDKLRLSKTVKELFWINTLVTCGVIVFLILSFVWIDKFRTNRWLFIISIGQIALAPFSMEWLYGGLEQYTYITKRAILFKLVSLVLIFGFVHTKNDYIIYAFILAVACVGNYICNFVYSKKFISFKIKDKLELQKHMKPILTFFASLLAISIYTNLDSLMLGFISGDKAVGLYDVAVKAKTVILSLINAISAVLLPRLSYYIAQEEQENYNNTLKSSIRIILMISIPLTVFFEIEAWDCIFILGGMNYVAAVPCMMILMPILLISGFSNITGNQILIPHGLENCYTKAVICGAFVDVIFNALFMPIYGIYGAAIATLLAEVTQMLVQTFFSKKYLRNKIEKDFARRILIATLVAGIITAVLRLMVRFNPFLNILICSGGFFICYISFLFAMKIEEIYMVLNKLKK
ncbi:flippase [Clostridium sp. TF11-13AC]|uniref:flippase n=1 Tax=Clostridium sp. TF11-13AC TaxID=2293053 RepID=UPI000E540090|nr:flippase [Clostridium sp. TF11-13AC]RHU44993.1 flippase [Clostridium sp. TF11-13AC]